MDFVNTIFYHLNQSDRTEILIVICYSLNSLTVSWKASRSPINFTEYHKTWIYWTVYLRQYRDDPKINNKIKLDVLVIPDKISITSAHSIEIRLYEIYFLSKDDSDSSWSKSAFLRMGIFLK